MTLEQDYYYRRAENELRLAQEANHPAAVKAHYVLAGFYLDRVYGQPEPDPGVPFMLRSDSRRGSRSA